MTRAFSDDLRSRVLAASRDGMSARSTAVRFGIGISTGLDWQVPLLLDSASEAADCSGNASTDSYQKDRPVDPRGIHILRGACYPCWRLANEIFHRALFVNGHYIYLLPLAVAPWLAAGIFLRWFAKLYLDD